MTANRDQAGRLEQLAAMRDASAGAFEAARINYLRLLTRLEEVSIDYIQGRCEREIVCGVLEQLIEAKFLISENARRTRMYQDAFESARQQVGAKSRRHHQVLVPSRRKYLELSTGA